LITDKNLFYEVTAKRTLVVFLSLRTRQDKNLNERPHPFPCCQQNERAAVTFSTARAAQRAGFSLWESPAGEKSSISIRQDEDRILILYYILHN